MSEVSPWRSKDTVKIGIIGSKEFKPLYLVENEVRTIFDVWGDSYPLDKIVIISGGARGPDSLAIRAAKELGLGTKEYPVDAKGVSGVFEYTLRAMVCHGQIAEASDWIIAFWDGRSRDTLDTMRKAKKLGKKVDVITPQGERIEWNE